jgi:hypothetical protein
MIEGAALPSTTMVLKADVLNIPTMLAAGIVGVLVIECVHVHLSPIDE